MITRLSVPGAVCLVAVASLSIDACQRVPLLAPSGSTIVLNASNNVLPVNGSTTIIAQVLEPAGTPPHSGTHVTFTTSLGTIQPAEAETDISGRATVTFLAGNASGTANITALSGGASVGANGALKILVGSAAVGRINLSASPTLVPATGGQSTITATVFDVNGNTLPSAQVSFSTSAGTLTAGVANTDSSGNAQTILRTTTKATVTATVGAQGGSTTTPGTGTGTTPTTPTASGQSSAQIVIDIASAPTLVITPPTTAPSAGLPAAFTFAVTAATANGSAVQSLVVDWGDGSTQNLGAISGSSIQSHVYRFAGTFTITATLTDTAGNVIRQSTSVTVIPVARPTIIITPTPQSAPGGSTISFQINITVPSGLGIQDVVIDFGDNSSQDLGGFSGVVTLQHAYPAGVKTYTVTVTVTDSTGQKTTGSAVVSITT